MIVPVRATSDLTSSPRQAATIPTAMALLALIPAVEAWYDRFLIVITQSRPSSPTALVAAATAFLTPSFQSSLTMDPPPRFISLNLNIPRSLLRGASFGRLVPFVESLY
ncbi:MAG: hypothetical protein L0H94_09930 [Nitrospira sp.]|nr:hypothetical protein [Nitrospira sp.]